jgi:hypothetical protein
VVGEPLGISSQDAFPRRVAPARDEAQNHTVRMDSDTDRSTDELTYLRRQMIVLAGVLTTLGLVIWACTASSGDSASTPIRNAGETASLTPTLPSVLPTITITATTTVTVTPKPSRRDGDACDPGDLVTTLSATADTYRRGELPQFQLTVVNVGEHACTYDVGPNVLQTKITSGSDRIWSSTHCASDDDSSIQLLRRGVPHIATLTWDRKRSDESCPDDPSTADAGTYVAHLKADGIRTARQVFRLR